MVKYKELINFIKTRLPGAKFDIKFEGKEPHAAQVDRVIINVKNKENFSFRLGENLVFIFESIPRKILKYQTLAHPKEVQKFVNQCIDNIEKYKENLYSLSIINHCRRYFGKELKYEKLTKADYVYYNKFYLISTPEHVLLVSRKDNRTVRVIEFKDKVNLDKIFKELNYYVEQINREP